MSFKVAFIGAGKEVRSGHMKAWWRKCVPTRKKPEKNAAETDKAQERPSAKE